MTHVLVSDRVLLNLDKHVESLIANSDGVYLSDTSDVSYRTALRRYMLFSRWPSLLDKVGVTLTSEEMVYNSYYWMLKLSKIHTAIYGVDAGIDQQVFLILEQAKCDIDWGVIEEISTLVETSD